MSIDFFRGEGVLSTEEFNRGEILHGFNLPLMEWISKKILEGGFLALFETESETSLFSNKCMLRIIFWTNS